MHEFPKKIKTKRAVLQKIALDDAAGWKSFNNQIAKRMPWPAVPSIVYARNEILHYEAMWERGTRYVYSIKWHGKVIGDFHLKSIDKKRKRLEFGHALHPSVWGTGITYEVLDAIKSIMKKRRLAAWGKVEEENIRSWKSLEKYKAKFIGTRTLRIDGVKKRMRFYEL